MNVCQASCHAWRFLRTIALVIFITEFFAFSALAAVEGGQSADWNGLYTAISLGLSRSDADLGVTTQHTDNYFTDEDHEQIRSSVSKTFKPTELTGNIYVGRNWQSGHWVYGLEGVLSLSNFDEERHQPYTAFITAPAQSFRFDTSLVSHWNAKLMPRIGYAQGKNLFFASAGPALTQIEYDFTYQDKAVNNEYSHLSTNNLAFGWSVGLGLEYKLQDDWALKIEATYTEFNNAIKKSSGLINYDDGFVHDFDYLIRNFQIGIVKFF